MKQTAPIKPKPIAATFSVADRKKDLEQLAADIDPFNFAWEQLSHQQQSLLKTLNLDRILQQDPYQFTKLLLLALHDGAAQGPEN